MQMGQEATQQLTAAWFRAPAEVLARLLEDVSKPAIDAGLLDRCAQRLLNRREVIGRLETERGIHADTAVEFRLGLTVDSRLDFGTRRRECRLVVPIYDSYGSCRNVALYNRKARPKLRRLAGRRLRLYPERAFRERLDKPFTITEGELDAVLGWEEGLRTVTAGGACAYRVFEENLGQFTGARTRIAYDNDEAGRRGARRLASLLRSVAEDVQVVRIPLSNPGADLTDWILSLRRAGAQHAA